MIGKTLLQYEVREKIGEGGMGEVYRAHDSKLGRDVALKFLPDTFAEDADRLSRFEREARLLASLNHANIASIHGLEEVASQRFLVLEMIGGEDLSQRLSRGAIPIDETLAICRQVAEALEAAHEEGVIHRDLKPANIKVAPDGKVKVLDFGLAKAWEGGGDSVDLSRSPTALASSPTVAGVILGTAPYMSPEQARGHAVDKRSDVFSFGCVLYEMLAGKAAFIGDTVSDTLAAVLRAQPEWDALPQDTPRAVKRLLKRCLDKNPKERLRDIGEARITIDAVLRGDDEESPSEGTAVAAPGGGRGSILAWALAGFFFIVAAAATVGMLRKGGTETPVLRTSITPPKNVRFNLRGIHPGPVVISPDGKRIVFAGREAGGASMLFVRDLDATEARPLPGTEGAGYPFWSPDGRSIGFFTQNKLKRVDIVGGPPLTLCDSNGGKGGTWNADGTIVFSVSFNTPLHRVADVGGLSTPVTEINRDAGENSHRFPRFLPDGDHFLYFARMGGEASAIRIGSLSGETDINLMPALSNVTYASGMILFLRETTLMGRPFDPAKLAFTGDPVPVADPVRYIPGAMYGLFDASDDGTLIYQGGVSIPGARLTWRDLEGKETGTLGDIVQQITPAVSRDGRQTAVTIFDNIGGTSDIWIYDNERNMRTRFTFDPSNDAAPVWSPDGSRIVFSGTRSGGRYQLYIKDVGGASEERMLVETPGTSFSSDWSGDGRYIVFNMVDTTSTTDIWAVSLGGEADVIPLVVSPYTEDAGVVSPDGRWLAYTSNESGRNEIYVTPFPTTGRKWQVSSGGGDNARWRRDGKAIYYFGNNAFHSVEVESKESTFVVGGTRTLFQTNTAMFYTLPPQGDRLLVLEDADEGGIMPLTLVTNWKRDLERRTAAR